MNVSPPKHVTQVKSSGCFTLVRKSEEKKSIGLTCSIFFSPLCFGSPDKAI